jgi:hypothetical protein
MNATHALVTRERLVDCKVPERLTTTITSPSFDWNATAVRAARDFAESTTTLLALAGPSGTGKSCAAGIAVALAWRPGTSEEIVLPAARGEPGAYLYRDNPGQWVVNIPVDGVGSGARRGRWLNASACTEHLFDDRWWDTVRACGALVIDDIGLELDQRTRDRLLGLIVDRDNDDRRTVLTTNLAASDFRDRYCAGAGERLRTRIRRGMWINVPSRPAPVLTEVQP